MQINLKDYLLKKRTFSAELHPSPIRTRAKEGAMSSNDIYAVQVELHAQEYANESKGF